VKYWFYLLAKLLLLAGLLSGLWTLLHLVWPPPEPFMRVHLEPFGHDLGYTTAILGFFLMSVGMLYLVILDQRFRCRTCLRRLRMPVTHGAWNHFLLGPPRTDYICLYGHGTLRVGDLHGSGQTEEDWKPIDDMWKELEQIETSNK
jgi:hypothetical protein